MILPGGQIFVKARSLKILNCESESDFFFNAAVARTFYYDFCHCHCRVCFNSIQRSECFQVNGNTRGGRFCEYKF